MNDYIICTHSIQFNKYYANHVQTTKILLCSIKINKLLTQ